MHINPHVTTPLRSCVWMHVCAAVPPPHPDGTWYRCLMFVQVAPASCDVSETLCSLNFAQRVRLVEFGQGRLSRPGNSGSATAGNLGSARGTAVGASPRLGAGSSPHVGLGPAAAVPSPASAARSQPTEAPPASSVDMAFTSLEEDLAQEDF